MWTLVVLLFGFLVAAIALSVLSLYMNQLEQRVADFCEIVRDRYRPTFHSDLEQQASQQIEDLGKTLKD